MAEEATLRIYRGDNERGEMVEYKVPLAPGMVVLDAVHAVQAMHAPDLAVRWNCKAGKCGSCSAEINGHPKLMCMTRVNSLNLSEPVTVEPMKAFPVIKDLVTDVSWNFRVKKGIARFAPRPADAADGTWRMAQRDMDRVGAQLARAVQGIGAACRALEIPITGGNVSLYNETDGRAVLPTPVLGVVGLIEDADRVARRTFQAAGDAVMLLGDSRAELGGSEYLKVLHGLVKGVPPALDLVREAALQRLLVEGIAAGVIRSAHDCAEGGIGITLAECCFDTGLGVSVDVSSVDADSAFADIATLFSESASRVIVSVAPNAVPDLLARARAMNVPAARIGNVGGSRIRVNVDGRQVLDESLAESEALWSGSLERYFERARAIA